MRSADDEKRDTFSIRVAACRARPLVLQKPRQVYKIKKLTLRP